MSIYEYNEEYVRKSLFEDGVEEGYTKGYDSGQRDGSSRGEARQLIKNVESVMSNLNVDLQKSCEILDITVEEYNNAKAQHL